MTSEWKQEIASEIAQIIAKNEEVLALLQDTVQKWLNHESPKELLPLRFAADYSKDEQLIFLAAIHDVYTTSDNRIISLNPPIEKMLATEKDTKQRSRLEEEYKQFVRWENLKLEIKNLPNIRIADYDHDENYIAPDHVTSKNKQTKKEKEAAQRADLYRMLFTKPKRHETGEDDVRADLEFGKFLNTCRSLVEASNMQSAKKSTDTAVNMEHETESEGIIRKFESTCLIIYKDKQIPIDGRLKGAKLLAFLLSNPHKSFTAIEALQKSGLRKKEKITADNDLDADGKKYLESLIREYEKEESQAYDPAEKAEYRDQIKQIQEKINKSTNIHGRSRTTNMNKYSVSARDCIETLKNKIREDHPELHAHLCSFLKVGEVCLYAPDFEIKWRIH